MHLSYLVPSAPMRAASLSHLKAFGSLQIAYILLFAMVPQFVDIVNSFCRYIAICNEIVIAKYIETGYNNCRLQ